MLLAPGEGDSVGSPEAATALFPLHFRATLVRTGVLFTASRVSFKFLTEQ